MFSNASKHGSHVQLKGWERQTQHPCSHGHMNEGVLIHKQCGAWLLVFPKGYQMLCAMDQDKMSCSLAYNAYNMVGKGW